MLGLLEPTTGSVSVLGHVAARRQSPAAGSAPCSSRPACPSNVRVGELVEFARRLYPHPLSQAAVLERSGLTALSDRSVDRLSGGEGQRLRFAIGIAGDPDLVFLDEPTVAMDVETRRAFWADMRRSATEGRTILFATHYLEEADQVADRIIVLDHGRIVADGTGRVDPRPASRPGRSGSIWPAPTRARSRSSPRVTEIDVRGDAVRLVSDDADRTVREIFRADLPIRDLEVTGADLEDAFIALTSTPTDRQEATR